MNGGERVPEQERDASPANDLERDRRPLDHKTDAQDPKKFEERVGQATDQYDRQHVLPQDSLTQDERVLRADRGNQREAAAEADERGSEHEGEDISSVLYGANRPSVEAPWRGPVARPRALDRRVWAQRKNLAELTPGGVANSTWAI